MAVYIRKNGIIRAYSKWYKKNEFEGDMDVNRFATKKQLVDWFISESNITWHVVKLNPYIMDFVQKHNLKNIISMGSGLCVQEHLLKQSLPKDYIVAGVDYSKEAIDAAKKFFPELILDVFDLKKDSFRELQDKLNVKFDFAFFVNSAYCMSETEFIKLFKEMRECGVKYIIDWSGGIIYNHNIAVPEWWHRVSNALSYLLTGKLKWRELYIPEGRPFGYARTIPELRKLYYRAGYNIEDEPEVGNSRYVGVLIPTDKKLEPCSSSPPCCF